MKGGHGWWRDWPGGRRVRDEWSPDGKFWLGREVRLENFQAYALEGEKEEMS